jgi:hypothetical protein
VRRLARPAALAFSAAAFLVALASPASADNCDLEINPEDCENTAWTVGAVALTAAGVTTVVVAAAAGAPGAGPPAVPGRTVGQVATGDVGGPAFDPPPGHPPIHQQVAGDSCAQVSVRMIHQRLTGNDIPENALRAQGRDMPNGYRRNARGFGTMSEGTVDHLRQLGHQAESKNMTLDQMHAALASGKQITVVHSVPGGGTHRVVLSGMEDRGGRKVLTFDDPWTGKQFRRTDVWWNSQGIPGGTVVVDPPPVTGE